MSTITTIDLKKSFAEGRLDKIVHYHNFVEALEYQHIKYQEDIFLDIEICKKYVNDNKIAPFLNTNENRSILLEESKCLKDDLYKRNMILKKINYFNTILKMKNHSEIYNLIIQINWYVFQIIDYSIWNEFIGSIKGVFVIHEVKNTRPLKGFKPNKISSKIIYNKNG